ncbi:MAG: cobalamin biosynthesis protein CobD [Deltaproteobacteria bacterium]|nr:cobalamin biosynthesis protein CobD [Deltaproteobacteria bacterium]
MPSCALHQIFVLIAAWLFDALVGDPEKLPHPVRAIGALIVRLEHRAPQWFKNKKNAGVCIGIFVPATAYVGAFFFIALAGAISVFVGLLASVVCIYYCLATRCLASEAAGVYRDLKKGDIIMARHRLSRIVGRDTAHLSESDIVRATVETVSENTVDGIISPLVYAALGGAPLALAFKAVSTLDSMIGYKNEKYRELGWFSARLDDVLNFIPARLCLILVPLASLVLPFGHSGSAFKTGMRDGRKSPSPNSGFPEACFAGSLGIQLGGQCSYAGVISGKPLIGDKDREIAIYDIQRAVSLMWAVSGLCLVFCTGIFFIITIVWGC